MSTLNPPRSSIRTLVGGLLLLLAPSAGADDLRKCSDLPEPSRQSCAQEAQQKCASIEKYWDRRRCEHEIAAASNPCTSPAWATACDAFKKDYWEICRKSSLSTYSRVAELEAWLGRAEAYPAFVGRARKMIADWRMCITPQMGTAACNVSPVHLAECQQAEINFKQGWQGVLKSFGEHAKGALGELDRSRTHADVLAALRSIDSVLDDGAALLKSNQVPLITVPPAPIEAALAKLRQRRADGEALATKLLAEARCPSAKLKDAALEAELRAALAKQADGTTLGRLSLQERYSYRIGRAERTLVDEVGSFVSYKDRGGKCFVTSVTFRRLKPDEASWSAWGGAWGLDSQLLCEHLND